MGRKLRGLARHLGQLARKAAKAKKDWGVDVAVGYTASYALIVHEDLTKAHGSEYNTKHAADIAAGKKHSRGAKQRAKFLTVPLAENRQEYAMLIAMALKAGRTPADALLQAGLAWQRDSQKLVPVDKGFLKASAFTRLENK